MIVWEPIETAPKDGTRILMWRDGLVQTAWWKLSEGDVFPAGWGGRGWWYPEWDQPTHWAPHPPAPWVGELGGFMSHQTPVVPRGVYEST